MLLVATPVIIVTNERFEVISFIGDYNNGHDDGQFMMGPLAATQMSNGNIVAFGYYSSKIQMFYLNGVFVDKIELDNYIISIVGLLENKLLVCYYDNDEENTYFEILKSDIMSMTDVLSYDTFMEHLRFENFDNNQYIQIIKDIIREYSETSKNYLKTLLKAMTGIQSIPPSGYDTRRPLHIKLRTYNCEQYQPIEIDKCFNQIILGKKLFVEYIDNPDKSNTVLRKILSVESLNKLMSDAPNA